MVTDPRRLQQRFAQAADAFKMFACAPPSGLAWSMSSPAQPRTKQVHAAETRLLYENSTTGIVASVVIALALAFVQRSITPPAIVSLWLAYVVAIAAVRFVITLRFRRELPRESDSERWNTAFVVGTALAAAGWGGAATVFYQPSEALSGIFLVFVIGGVMLGGASLLAARPEAFLTFLLPIGLLTALRLANEGDEEHLMMGFLAGLFTVATIATTWRFHQTIASSLKLRFDNVDLIESLKAEKDHTEALNRDLERRVHDRTARLTEADQRKDEFLATLAHELRNPLAPIRFAVENLRSSTPPATAALARDVIERQVRQLVRLVDDLLDVSRITTNKLVLRREPHDLSRLMSTAVESIIPLATAASHTLTVEPPATALCVNGDGVRLVQVFANVLNNAVKFTPPCGHLWFTAEQRGHEVVVRIRDTGIGIAPDVLPRVFDMFQQADAVLERSTGGLGIGLTLVRRLVEMHDGRIDIRSAGTGLGTEVDIHLPLSAAAGLHPVPSERRATAPSRPLRVLIVEDNPDAAEMLDVAVSHLGHETRQAHDGASAIVAATQFVPDVVFLDIGLPVMSGYAVARALRERPELAHVHLAAITGWGQDEDRRKAREAGFDSHFTKPLSPEAMEDLLARVAQGLAGGGAPAATPRTRHTDSGVVF